MSRAICGVERFWGISVPFWEVRQKRGDHKGHTVAELPKPLTTEDTKEHRGSQIKTNPQKSQSAQSYGDYPVVLANQEFAKRNMVSRHICNAEEAKEISAAGMFSGW
jgi:hypothetical protein